MADTKTPKTTKQMVKIQIVAYIPAPDVMDRESFERCHAKLEKIEAFMKEETHEVDRFTKISVGRHYPIEEPKQDENEETGETI